MKQENIFKLLSTLLLVILTSAAFTSCSDDDKETVITLEQIMGKWENNDIEIEIGENQILVKYEYDDYRDRYLGESLANFNYRNNSIFITKVIYDRYTGHDSEEVIGLEYGQELRVSFSGNNLVLTFIEDGEEDGATLLMPIDY